MKKRISARAIRKKFGYVLPKGVGDEWLKRGLAFI